MITEQQDYYTSLIERLRRLPVETEWLEYKSNNTDPQMIGEYISALKVSSYYVVYVFRRLFYSTKTSKTI